MVAKLVLVVVVVVVVAITRAMDLGMPMAVVQSAAGTVGLTQTVGVAVVLALRMEAVAVTAELVAELIRRQLHRSAPLLSCNYREMRISTCCGTNMLGQKTSTASGPADALSVVSHSLAV